MGRGRVIPSIISSSIPVTQWPMHPRRVWYRIRMVRSMLRRGRHPMSMRRRRCHPVSMLRRRHHPMSMRRRRHHPMSMLRRRRRPVSMLGQRRHPIRFSVHEPGWRRRQAIGSTLHMVQSMRRLGGSLRWCDEQPILIFIWRTTRSTLPTIVHWVGPL